MTFKYTKLTLPSLIAIVFSISQICAVEQLKEKNNETRQPLTTQTYNPSKALPTKLGTKRTEKVFDKNHVIAETGYGDPIVLHKADKAVCKSIRETGYWEQKNTSTLLSLIHEGDIVIEAGANYGWYTILMGKAVGATGKVYSYEANPDVFMPLQETLKLNNDITSVEIKNIAISNQAYTGYMLYGLNNIGGGFILTPEQLPEEFTQGQKANSGFCEQKVLVRPITVTTFDDEFPDLVVNFLRMDIEGAEYFALKGGKQLIERSPQIIIALEWWDEHLRRIGVDENEFISFLKDQSFIPYHFENGLLVRVNYDFLVKRYLCDMVFSRQALT